MHTSTAPSNAAANESAAALTADATTKQICDAVARCFDHAHERAAGASTDDGDLEFTKALRDVFAHFTTCVDRHAAALGMDLIGIALTASMKEQLGAVRNCLGDDDTKMLERDGLQALPPPVIVELEAPLRDLLGMAKQFHERHAHATR